MIVCVCNNISDRRIRQTVDSGITSMSELRNQLGVATFCGKCHCCAKEVLRESLDNNKAGPQPTMYQHGAMAA